MNWFSKYIVDSNLEALAEETGKHSEQIKQLDDGYVSLINSVEKLKLNTDSTKRTLKFHGELLEECEKELQHIRKFLIFLIAGVVFLLIAITVVVFCILRAI